jgi:hypothetical protein
MILDDEPWNNLKEKAIEHFEDEREGQRKQAFFNHLNEAFAYRYLVRRGFKKVRLIRESKEKTPDISFVDRETQSYCEVKTMGLSDDEIRRRASHSVQDGAVYFVLNAGFLNKLEKDVARAWEQIHSLGERGLVFVLVRFDDIIGDHYRNNRKQLTTFCRSRGFENLVFKIDHRGNKGIHI